VSDKETAPWIEKLTDRLAPLFPIRFYATTDEYDRKYAAKRAELVRIISETFAEECTAQAPTQRESTEGEDIAKKIIIDTEVRQLQRSFEGLGTVSDRTSEPLMRAALSRVWDAARYETEATPQGTPNTHEEDICPSCYNSYSFCDCQSSGQVSPTSEYLENKAEDSNRPQERGISPDEVTSEPQVTPSYESLESELEWNKMRVAELESHIESQATPQGTPTCRHCNLPVANLDGVLVHRSTLHSKCPTAGNLSGTTDTIAEDAPQPAECPQCGSKDFWTVLPACHGGKAHKWHAKEK
jgi:rubrerythrin